MFAEVFCEEEVAVFLVVGNIELKGCQLGATLRRHALRRRILLREHGLQLQLAKLHVGAYTKQARRTLDE